MGPKYPHLYVDTNEHTDPDLYSNPHTNDNTYTIYNGYTYKDTHNHVNTYSAHPHSNEYAHAHAIRCLADVPS